MWLSSIIYLFFFVLLTSDAYKGNISSQLVCLACSTKGENEIAYRILARRSGGKNHWEDQEVSGW
jgi:hypothetical protein